MMTTEEAQAAVGKRIRNVTAFTGINGAKTVFRGSHYVLEQFEEGPPVKFVTSSLDRDEPPHDRGEMGLKMFVTHEQWEHWPASMKKPL